MMNLTKEFGIDLDVYAAEEEEHLDLEILKLINNTIVDCDYDMEIEEDWIF